MPIKTSPKEPPPKSSASSTEDRMQVHQAIKEMFDSYIAGCCSWIKITHDDIMNHGAEFESLLWSIMDNHDDIPSLDKIERMYRGWK